MPRSAFCLDCPSDVNVPYRGLLSILAAVKMTGFKLPYQEQPNNPDTLKAPPSDGKNLIRVRILHWVVDLGLVTPQANGHHVPVCADPYDDTQCLWRPEAYCRRYKGLATHGQSGDGTVRY